MGSNDMKRPEDTEPRKLKPCCACPETKKARDACIIENGEENCKSYIEAHKECMRKMGFNIWRFEHMCPSAGIFITFSYSVCQSIQFVDKKREIESLIT